MRGVTIASRMKEILEQRHHRFGLAGESYAATIEQYLVSHPDSVLYVGSGLPDRNRFEHLEAYRNSAIVAEDDLRTDMQTFELATAEFVWANAKHLDKLERESFGHVLALGLFASIHTNEISKLFRKFWRVCRTGGYLALTNAQECPKQKYIEAGLQCGFNLVDEKEGNNPEASADGDYLLVFRKPFEAKAALAA